MASCDDALELRLRAAFKDSVLGKDFRGQFSRSQNNHKAP